MSSFGGLRARFHEQRPLFTALMVIPEPIVASILGSSGVDYVMIDAEHGPFTLSSLRACVEALKATQASIVVRTASRDPVEIQQVLDLGADGVLAPRIESADEAAAIVRAARYPPEGRRGVSPAVRAASYGLDTDYLGRANSSVAVMALIESQPGVDNVAEIAAVEGLDGIMIGLTDLSADLGVSGQFDHPRVRDAVDKVATCAVAAGLKIGGRATAQSDQELGSTLVYCFTDVIDFAVAVRRAVDAARES
jgi:2-keto-3-deoxy-L-rhamnonate aldolase RhmA